MKSSVSTIIIFEMKHKLITDFQMHPHSYQLQATFQGKINPDTGEIISRNFRETLMADIFNYYNGLKLDRTNFYNLNPTVENIANEIFKYIRQQTNQIHCIKLWESQEVSATVGY